MTQSNGREPEAVITGGEPDPDQPPATPARKRPRPGERRVQILQTLATMLEHPRGEKITTAALAARLSVSEAALYRHFASKAQMYEGLIGFIEQTVFGLINQITDKEEHGLRQAHAIVRMLLSFAEKNPGMTRVLTGEALVGEHERLQERINQLVDRIEASLRQCLKVAVTQAAFPADADIPARAALVMAAVQGQWQRYAKSGFRKSPSDHAEAHLRVLLG
ncbi:nucleoid occlusion factor SlmA [Cupriavidus taiwanensis]|uniref:Transcriptional regulator of dUTPase subunit (TetR/AcrR family) similar to E.coli ttk n=1 Tax=Cupriavidus taiwanensis TaxID=164546 RepID=A0A976A0S6_9BURK|nr:nucleoid occlusion factor SlmA [Cupriavidus taiwanensis]MDK3023297.1 nucleoid occlusion factor SlmA [Cupriavidus taiwanensis]NSX14904.1 nucleoid occlusion factor SlmA [Cupriavidus taiwanensis]SOY49907.1 putative transcriptional regulator of dUTPase subunit (TetR/AcrR family); similar to E.coli ttk [Cupriavidus taiwanensis]